MSEKLTHIIPIRCTYEEKCEFEIVSKCEKLSASEHGRILIKAEISRVKERINTLMPLMGIATYTVNTVETDLLFELTPQPILRDVTPKRKSLGTKKAQLCDQLSLIATSMNY